jgi:hypothetical protein
VKGAGLQTVQLPLQRNCREDWLERVVGVLVTVHRGVPLPRGEGPHRFRGFPCEQEGSTSPFEGGERNILLTTVDGCVRLSH